MKNYIIASVGEWNKSIYQDNLEKLSGKWHYVSNQKKLLIKIKKVKPDKIFFIHWRWIIKKDIYQKYECICFHMTSLPYGRGGSPLQNLIIRGKSHTQVCAFKINDILDGGPIYLRKKMSLKGNALEIYIRCTIITFKMIKKIIKDGINPIAQKGKVVIFKRRMPNESEISKTFSKKKIFDYVRMLDAPGYPNAYIKFGKHKISLRNAKFKGNKISFEGNIE
jgi:methionyl-tRNA formyltransferase